MRRRAPRPVRQSPTAGPSSTAPAADAEPSAATRSESIIARILAGITRVGPGAATMSRESRDLILSNLAILSRSARAVPANDSGGMGFRLYGIRRGSVLAALGLLNGDLLKSINGRPTTTPQEVLAAYSGLRGAGSWALSISRRGSEMTLVVRVVDGAPGGATPPATTTPIQQRASQRALTAHGAQDQRPSNTQASAPRQRQRLWEPRTSLAPTSSNMRMT
jgi:hypothetical protein